MSEENPNEALHLFGWAPGNYVITCRDCPPAYIGNAPTGEKKSYRCRDHATRALAKWAKFLHEDNQRLIEERTALKEAHDKRVTELIRYNSEQVIRRREINAHRMQLIGWVLKAAKQLHFYALNHREKAVNFGVTASEYEDIARSGSSPKSIEYREKEADSFSKSRVNDDLAQEGEEALIWEPDPGNMGRP